ncbi:hypothetical protein QLX08_002575 [Tetragonisca angustula]|uniref:Uncharacterized protein n=1 Tax=Tetragonisca angustula TaxID=166442 RepID=A0AAW1AAY1_9HYME
MAPKRLRFTFEHVTLNSNAIAGGAASLDAIFSQDIDNREIGVGVCYNMWNNTRENSVQSVFRDQIGARVIANGHSA